VGLLLGKDGIVVYFLSVTSPSFRTDGSR